MDFMNEHEEDQESKESELSYKSADKDEIFETPISETNSDKVKKRRATIEKNIMRRA